MSGWGEYGRNSGEGQTAFPERRNISHGTTIFKEGDEADCAYILESGAVQIFKMINGRRVVLGYVSHWGLFGEMGLIDDSPRMASAYVTEDAVCTVLSRENFSKMMDGAPQGMVLVIETLTRTLRNSGEQLADARYRIMELELEKG